MLEADALALLNRHLAGGPELDPGLPLSLLREHSWVVTDEDDVETVEYDVNRAAAEGWLLRANATAADYRIEVDGQKLERQQAWGHYLQMYRHYLSRARIRPQSVVRADVAY